MVLYFGGVPQSKNCHCTGTVTTGPGDAIISTKDTHNHPPSEAEVKVKKIVSALEEQTQANIRPVPNSIDRYFYLSRKCLISSKAGLPAGPDKPIMSKSAIRG